MSNPCGLLPEDPIRSEPEPMALTQPLHVDRPDLAYSATTFVGAIRKDAQATKNGEISGGFGENRKRHWHGKDQRKRSKSIDVRVAGCFDFPFLSEGLGERREEERKRAPLERRGIKREKKKESNPSMICYGYMGLVYYFGLF